MRRFGTGRRRLQQVLYDGNGNGSGGGNGQERSLLRLTSPINAYWKSESEVATMIYIRRCTVSLSLNLNATPLPPVNHPFIVTDDSPADHPSPSYPSLQFHDPQPVLLPLHHDGLHNGERSRRGLEGADDGVQGSDRTSACEPSSRDVRPQIRLYRQPLLAAFCRAPSEFKPKPQTQPLPQPRPQPRRQGHRHRLLINRHRQISRASSSCSRTRSPFWP